MTLAARFSRRLSSTQSIQLASEFLRYDMLRTLRYGMVSLKVSDFKVFLSGYIVNVHTICHMTDDPVRQSAALLHIRSSCYAFGHPVTHSATLLRMRSLSYRLSLLLT